MNTIEDLNTTDKETIGLKKILIDYFHHWRLFLLAFLISLIPAVIYLVYYPTTYEVMARIQLQEDRSLGSGSLGLGEAAGLMKSFGLNSAGGGAINMDDEIAKLLSSDLLAKMVVKLGVNINYNKPGEIKYYMYENTPVILDVDSVTNATLDKVLTFKVSIDKSGKVSIINKGDDTKLTFESLPAKIQTPDGTFVLSYAKDKVAPYSLTIDVIPAKWVAEDLSEEFTIEEYSKTSNVIEFLCKEYERKRGVDMLNTLIHLYNEQEDLIEKEEGRKSIAFLDGRIQNVLQELASVEYNIEKYKTQNQMTDLEYDILFYTEQMKELQTKIIELEAQLNVLNLMDSYIKDPKNKYNLVPALLTVSEGEKSPVSAYNEALLERERILQSSKSTNPLIENINKQVDQLRSSVFLSIENAKKGANQTLSDLKLKENTLFKKMGTVPALERTFIDFKRQQEIFQAVYLILLQKREEIALSVGEDKNKARIIDPAFVKQRPVGPRKLFAALGMILLTLVIPVGYLFVKAQFKDLKEEYIKSKKGN